MEHQLSSIGFGTWVIGGSDWSHAWGPQDDNDSIRSIQAAIAAGINWIDTAPASGLGHAEELVGQALSNLSANDRPMVFTKCGLVPLGEGSQVRLLKTMEETAVRRDLDASLRRIGVDVIDLYYVHHPADGAFIGDPPGMSRAELQDRVADYWSLMAELKKAGKVRAIALSNHPIDLLDVAENIAHVDAVQLRFSALDRVAAPEIQWCRQHGTAVHVYSPMESGLLTGGWTTARLSALPANDWRATSQRFRDGVRDAAPVVDTMRAIALDRGVTTGVVALSWVQSWPGVTAAIAGARSPDQAEQLADALDLTLRPDELERLAEQIAKLPGDRGPVRPTEQP